MPPHIRRAQLHAQLARHRPEPGAAHGHARRPGPPRAAAAAGHLGEPRSRTTRRGHSVRGPRLELHRRALHQPGPAAPDPSAGRAGRIDYRLLVNQFNEELRFNIGRRRRAQPRRQPGPKPQRRPVPRRPRLRAEDHARSAVDDKPREQDRAAKPGSRDPPRARPLPQHGRRPDHPGEPLPRRPARHHPARRRPARARDRSRAQSGLRRPNPRIDPRSSPGYRSGCPATSTAATSRRTTTSTTNLFQGIYDPTQPTALLNRSHPSSSAPPSRPNTRSCRRPSSSSTPPSAPAASTTSRSSSTRPTPREMKFQMWILELRGPKTRRRAGAGPPVRPAGLPRLLPTPRRPARADPLAARQHQHAEEVPERTFSAGPEPGSHGPSVLV